MNGRILATNDTNVIYAGSRLVNYPKGNFTKWCTLAKDPINVTFVRSVSFKNPAEKSTKIESISGKKLMNVTFVRKGFIVRKRGGVMRWVTQETDHSLWGRILSRLDHENNKMAILGRTAQLNGSHQPV